MNKQTKRDMSIFRAGFAWGTFTTLGVIVAAHCYTHKPSTNNETLQPPKVELPIQNTPFYQTPLNNKILEFKDGELHQYRELENRFENPLPIPRKGNFWA